MGGLLSRKQAGASDSTGASGVIGAGIIGAGAVGAPAAGALADAIVSKQAQQPLQVQPALGPGYTDVQTAHVPPYLILINQAECLRCRTVVQGHGSCKCGNVIVYGGFNSLGRLVRDPSKYADVSLVEYRK